MLGVVIAVLLSSLVVALASHVILVILTFRGGTRRGVLAVVVPPLAWAAPFSRALGARQRTWARVCFVSLVLSALVLGAAVDIVAAWVHALDVVSAVAGGHHH